ncbi:Leucine Rich repeats (2 copies) [Caulifigura coniformis]|uniref:Leucine Rich repeats (2 copies) n=1 Tax=Caulifigura coniformis TaxID=2527983 RepID=A0A517SD33_9PLAN|nr:hypothetical protein [Caulifigura coniformis]QDT54015.1 Leucine Rich repeats (2 copies) [Caulifigura coniformis]
MSDFALEVILYAGLLLAALGIVWLLVTAFRRSAKRGLAVTLIPPLALWHVWNAWPKTRGPALLTVIGLSAALFPMAYTRLKPIDLGERVRIVDGEKHVTLTGWDRPNYAAIAQHPDCVVLQMANPDVDDKALHHVAKLESLKELDLDGTAISDRGLKDLSSLVKLERLRISRTKISDTGFRESIATLPALKQLWCPETEISKAALNEWKAAGEGRRFIGGRDAAPAVDASAPTPDASSPPAEATSSSM